MCHAPCLPPSIHPPAALLAGGRTPPSAHLATELYCALPGLRLAGYRMLALLCTASPASSMLPLQGLVARMLSGAMRAASSGGGLTLAAVPPVERTALYRSASALMTKCGLSAGRALQADVLGVLGVELYGVVLQHASLNVPGKAGIASRPGASSLSSIGAEMVGSPAKKQKTGKGGLDLPSQVCVWRHPARRCVLMHMTIACLPACDVSHAPAGAGAASRSCKP